jgi:hypothetical protein
MFPRPIMIEISRAAGRTKKPLAISGERFSALLEFVENRHNLGALRFGQCLDSFRGVGDNQTIQVLGVVPVESHLGFLSL